ncbi:MAG TPA: hemolysin III family protein [Limnobacter sp.]|uniref:PAQR family membrane homeostasis protein TrhA n=1 Tax=Limnobacter sp. TaxID=2003368 RepID=UPI002ED91968
MQPAVAPVVAPTAPYSPAEELANALSHGLAALAAAVVAVLLVLKSAPVLSASELAGVVVYGASLVLLFAASTLYHATRNVQAKAVFKRMDHCAIYLLIAGTYTPMLMLTLHTTSATVLLWVVWALACAGIVFKLFFIHRFKRLSLITYLLMGWSSIVLIRDLWEAFPRDAFWLLIGGGLCFTVGAGFYAAKKVKFTHAVWHLWVVAGAACHCAVIWFYVIPSTTA